MISELFLKNAKELELRLLASTQCGLLPMLCDITCSYKVTCLFFARRVSEELETKSNLP